MEEKSAESLFAEYVTVIRRLRKECPWDKEQTHESLRTPLIEETYEVVEAAADNDRRHIRNELGDLLLLIVLQTIIAEEENSFTISDVLLHSMEKLIRRHPHVFGKERVTETNQVRKKWEEIKRQEGKASILDGVPNQLPALIKAQRIQEKASAVGFDWTNKTEVWKKVEEELQELGQAERMGDDKHVEEEFGDLLFALVNYSRFIGVNAEFALRKSVDRFGRRFHYVEEALKQRGKNPGQSSFEEMDELWNVAKTRVD